MLQIHCSSVGRAPTVTGEGNAFLILLACLNWELMMKGIFIAEIIKNAGP